MVNVGSAVEPACRSPAIERRLRGRRQEARIRARLAADAGLLSAHHASAPPGASAPDLQAQVHSLVSEVATLRLLVRTLATSVETLSARAEPPSGVRGRRTAQAGVPSGAASEGGMPGPASEKDRRGTSPLEGGEECEKEAQKHDPQPSAKSVTGGGTMPIFQTDMGHARHEPVGTAAKNLLLPAAATEVVKGPFSRDMGQSSRAISPTVSAPNTAPARRADAARESATTTTVKTNQGQGKEDGADATTLRSTPSSAVMLGRETVAPASSTASQGEGDGADDDKSLKRLITSHKKGALSRWRHPTCEWRQKNHDKWLADVTEAVQRVVEAGQASLQTAAQRQEYDAELDRSQVVLG